MSQLAEIELIDLGHRAASHVAGLGTVHRLKVTAGQDSSERPAYFFSFLIDQDRDRQRAGLIRSRLVQQLRDELIALHDGHYPIVQVFSQADWEKREGA